MAYLNHCRLCLQLVADPVTAANVYTKLPDGIPLAEHLDTLFDVLALVPKRVGMTSQALASESLNRPNDRRNYVLQVGDYSDGDDLKLLCSQCVSQITKCATGEASDAEAEAIGQRFQSLEGNARMFVRNQKLQNSSSGLNASTNSAFGMTTPKAAAPRPVVSASTGSKRPATEQLTMGWLLSQPSTSGTSRFADRSQKKIVVREIEFDDDDDEDGRETVVKTKCPFCKKTYIRHFALVKHIETIHPEQKVKFKKCDRCQRNFLNAAELKAHKCSMSYGGGRGWFGRRRSWWW